MGIVGATLELNKGGQTRGLHMASTEARLETEKKKLDAG